jgi:hypothetical protein
LSRPFRHVAEEDAVAARLVGCRAAITKEQTMKRLLSIAVAVVFVATAFTASAFAAHTPQVHALRHAHVFVHVQRHMHVFDIRCHIHPN